MDAVKAEGDPLVTPFAEQVSEAGKSAPVTPMYGQIQGKKFLVHYTVNGFGQIQNVWILTADEATKRPWPTTPEEASKWVFDPTMQTWSKP